MLLLSVERSSCLFLISCLVLVCNADDVVILDVLFFLPFTAVLQALPKAM